MALMYEILVARNEFAATLTSSAVGRSVPTSGTPVSRIGAKAARRRSRAQGELVPNTRRSGRKVSSTAKPSRRNSGFHASSTSAPAGANSRTIVARRAAVPTGTVDLPTTSARRSRCTASPPTAASTWARSAAYESLPCGVPTQMKWMSPKAAASASEVEKLSRPVASVLPSSSGRPGSKKGREPLASAATLSGSTSTPSTSNPSEAMHTAWVAPRYPVPITVRRGFAASSASPSARGARVGAAMVSVMSSPWK